MKPKIIFLDADGTLWNFHDLNAHARKRRLSKATLDSYTLPLLKALKRKRIPVIIISYQSFTTRSYAKRKLLRWLRHFKLSSYISEIHIAHKRFNPKSKVIRSVLTCYALSPQQALFIGDRYRWDYCEARKAGVHALLLNKPENKSYRVPKTTLKEVLQSLR